MVMRPRSVLTYEEGIIAWLITEYRPIEPRAMSATPTAISAWPNLVIIL